MVLIASSCQKQLICRFSLHKLMRNVNNTETTVSVSVSAVSSKDEKTNCYNFRSSGAAQSSKSRRQRVNPSHCLLFIIILSSKGNPICIHASIIPSHVVFKTFSNYTSIHFTPYSSWSVPPAIPPPRRWAALTLAQFVKSCSATCWKRCRLCPCINGRVLGMRLMMIRMIITTGGITNWLPLPHHLPPNCCLQETCIFKRITDLRVIRITSTCEHGTFCSTVHKIRKHQMILAA